MCIPMNVSSAHVDPEVDEFELAGLTNADCRHVDVPRILEAPAALECEFMFCTRLPSGGPRGENNVVFGKVVGVHIAENILKNGLVDMLAYQPLARLGYMDYSHVESVFAIWTDRTRTWPATRPEKPRKPQNRTAARRGNMTREA